MFFEGEKWWLERVSVCHVNADRYFSHCSLHTLTSCGFGCLCSVDWLKAPLEDQCNGVGGGGAEKTVGIATLPNVSEIEPEQRNAVFRAVNLFEA